MIVPEMGWFEIIRVPKFDTNEVMVSNDKYIDKSYSRVIHLFNNIWIFRYPHPHKVVFDKMYGSKGYFTPLLKDFDVEHVLMIIKNPQSNAPVEKVHQVILNIIVTKYLDKKVFDYIYPWGETLSSISWDIRDSCHRTIGATPSQCVFGRYMIFNLASVIDW